MADIFGKNIKAAPGPIGRAETYEVYVGVPGTSGSSFVGLTQGIQNSYNQPLQRVYELGSFNTYMVSGRPIGTLSITRLVGLAVGADNPTLLTLLSDAFLQVDGSGGGTMTFKERTTGQEWVCSGCYVTQESSGVDANGILVSEQVAIEYQSLKMSGVGEEDPGEPSDKPNDANRQEGPSLAEQVLSFLNTVPDIGI